MVGWPLALVTLALAVCVSVPAFLNRERTLMSAGFCFCLFAVTAFYASMVAAVTFVLLGVQLVRDSRTLPPGAAG